MYCYHCWRCVFFRHLRCYKMKLAPWACWNNCHISWEKKKSILSLLTIFISLSFSTFLLLLVLFCSLLMFVSLSWRSRIKHTLRSRLGGGEFCSDASVLRTEQWSGRVFLNLLKKGIMRQGMGEWKDQNAPVEMEATLQLLFNNMSLCRYRFVIRRVCTSYALPLMSESANT